MWRDEFVSYSVTFGVAKVYADAMKRRVVFDCQSFDRQPKSFMNLPSCREGFGGMRGNVLMEPINLTRNLNIVDTEDLL